MGGNPRGIAFAPDSSVVYLTAESGQRLMEYTFSTGRLRTLISLLPGEPRHLVIDPTGQYLYASLNKGGQVVKIDIRLRRIVDRVDHRHEPADDRAGAGRPQPLCRELREPDAGEGAHEGHAGPPAADDGRGPPGRDSPTRSPRGRSGCPATAARSSASRIADLGSGRTRTARAHPPAGAPLRHCANERGGVVAIRSPSGWNCGSRPSSPPSPVVQRLELHGSAPFDLRATDATAQDGRPAQVPGSDGSIRTVHASTRPASTWSRANPALRSAGGPFGGRSTGTSAPASRRTTPTCRRWGSRPSRCAWTGAAPTPSGLRDTSPPTRVSAA